MCAAATPFERGGGGGREREREREREGGGGGGEIKGREKAQRWGSYCAN